MEKIKLKDVANFVAGQSPESKYYSYKEGTPFLQGNRTFGYKYPTIDTFTTKVTKLAKKGDILMSVRAPVGDLNIAASEVCIGRGLGSITAKDNNNEFLYYCLKYNIKNLLKQGNGTTYSSVTKDIVNDFEIIMPELKYRKRIGEYLSLVDRKIENSNKISTLINDYIFTIYNYWFIQFNYPNSDGKPYAATGGNLNYNQLIKKSIPDGWRVGKLSDFIESIKTGLNPRQHFKFSDGNIKYLTVKNLTLNGSLFTDNCDYIDEQARNIIHNRSDVKTGDILYASISPLGRAYLVQEKPQDWDINESIFSIRPNIENTSSLYLYCFLKSEEFIKKAEHSSTGSIFKGIRIDTILNMDVILPPKEICDKFEKECHDLMNIFNVKNKEVSTLSEMNKFLIPILMNEQVTINE